MLHKLQFLLLLALAAFLNTACTLGQDYKPFKLDVATGDALQGKNMEVDVVGVNGRDKIKWETYSMNKYWTAGDSFRPSVTKKTLVFGPGLPTEQTIDLKDPIWQKWLKEEGATYLFVVANLPGLHDDKPGNADPRRQSIDIDNNVYMENLSSHEIRIRVTPIGIQVLTPVKPKAVNQ